MDKDIPNDIRLTTEEVKQLYEGDQELTDEQIETIKDFMALAAVIAYEGLTKKTLVLNNPEQKDGTWTPNPIYVILKNGLNPSALVGYIAKKRFICVSVICGKASFPDQRIDFELLSAGRRRVSFSAQNQAVSHQNHSGGFLVL